MSWKIQRWNHMQTDIIFVKDLQGAQSVQFSHTNTHDFI
ncbi:hypothetical protein N624_0266 [Levilactobacillus brevis]|nr:hypothetical protein N624_0266 [Levilactobacillus brevis]